MVVIVAMPITVIIVAINNDCQHGGYEKIDDCMRIVEMIFCTTAIITPVIRMAVRVIGGRRGEGVRLD